MTARDTIARILFDEGGADEGVRSYEIADAVIAAVRAMPAEDQAELVGWPRRSNDFGPPPPPPAEVECCASGSCEVCRPSWAWSR